MMKNTVSVILIFTICIITLGCKKKKDDDAIKYLLLTRSNLGVRFTTPEQSVAVNKFEKLYKKFWASIFPSAYAETLYSGDASINAYFDTFYNNIGSLVGTYTPTKFRLPINMFILYDHRVYNPNHAIRFNSIVNAGIPAEGDNDWIHADFSNPITKKLGTIPSGDYNALILCFTGEYMRNCIHNVLQFTAQQQQKKLAYTASPEIEVTIPDYGGELTNLTEYRDYDLPTQNGCSSNDFIYPEGLVNIERIARKNISGNLFSFSWNYLAPFSMGDSHFITGRTKYLLGDPSSVFYISSKNTENSIVVNPSNFQIYTDSSLYVMGTVGIIKIPFDGFTVQGGESVNVEVVFDINNIISVYDNSTPADKTDDIVCLSRDWWKRISINVIK